MLNTYTKTSQLPNIDRSLISNDLFSVAEYIVGEGYSAKKISYNNILSAITYSITSNNFSLSNLNDIDITGITNGQTIIWNNGTFIPGNIGGGGSSSIIFHDINSATHSNWKANGSLLNGQVLSYNTTGTAGWQNTALSTLFNSFVSNSSTTMFKDQRQPVKYVSSNYTCPATESGTTYRVTTNDLTIKLPTDNGTNSLTGVCFTFCKVIGNTGVATITISGAGYIADSIAGGTIKNNTSSETYANITLQNVNLNSWIVTSAHGSWVTA